MVEPAGALAGLRVVDLSVTVPSAYTSMVFADFGADVVQIEPPGGARLRQHPSWPFWMRGKQSIVLNLHDDGDAHPGRKCHEVGDGHGACGNSKSHEAVSQR